MHFEQGIDKIKSALKHPLPGETAQHLMAPALRKTTNQLLAETPSHKLSSVLMLIYPDLSGKMNTIFIERPVSNSVHSGQIAFPGGKIESFDESPAHAALRETEEEIGVPPANIEILGNLSSLFIPASNFLVIPHVGITHTTPEFRPSPLEVKSIVTAPVSELLLMKPGMKIFSTSYGNLQAPFFEIAGFSVWGATAMMLSEFRVMMRK